MTCSERLAIAALCAVVLGAGAGCDPKSGGFTPLPPPFPLGFLPVVLSTSGGAGDVSFTQGGHLLAVDGSATVHRLALSDGSLGTAATSVGGGATVLRSVQGTPSGVIYVGDDAGNVYEIDEMGVATLLANTGPDPVTGLAVAPNGFGDMGGSLVAAVGASGIVVVDPKGEPPTPVTLTTAANYVDLAFSGTTLYALDAGAGEIDSVADDGTPTTFVGGFTTPVGMAIDPANREIVVSDAGALGDTSDDALRSVSLDGPPVIDLAPYVFSETAPAGVTFDGLGAIAFVTASSVVVRGATVPPLQPAQFGFVIGGTTAGYGDLELDRIGRLIGVANDDGDPGDNFVLRVTRDGIPSTIARSIGAADESLLGVAYDPLTQTIWVSTVLGNVFEISSGGAVSLLVAATPGVALLGLERAPANFGGFGGHLVATTEDGRVLTIDPANPTPATLATITTATVPSEPAALPDLVFSDDGLLYVVDSGIAQVSQATPVPRILEVSPAGAVTDLGVDPVALLLPDGIEIDDGGNRLLVAAADEVGGDRLLAVDLAAPTTPVALQTIDIDDGFFPTGVAYDRLGRAAVLGGSAITQIDAFVVFGP